MTFENYLHHLHLLLTCIHQQMLAVSREPPGLCHSSESLLKWRLKPNPKHKNLVMFPRGTFFQGFILLSIGSQTKIPGKGEWSLAAVWRPRVGTWDESHPTQCKLTDIHTYTQTHQRHHSEDWGTMAFPCSQWEPLGDPPILSACRMTRSIQGHNLPSQLNTGTLSHSIWHP